MSERRGGKGKADRYRCLDGVLRRFLSLLLLGWGGGGETRHGLAILTTLFGWSSVRGWDPRAGRYVVVPGWWHVDGRVKTPEVSRHAWEESLLGSFFSAYVVTSVRGLFLQETELRDTKLA